jgi:hypothetical protein
VIVHVVGLVFNIYEMHGENNINNYQSHPSLTFKPLNNWNVIMANRRHTTEIIQPMYVMICRAI